MIGSRLFAPSAAAAAPSNWERPRSIVVVDDEDTVRTLLVRWLEASGFDVIPARGADEALRRIQGGAVAVAVCDIRMPGHDGLWLAAQIRRCSPETAIVIASGVQDVEAALESLRQGVLDYLIKPFGRDRLRDAVQRALEWHDAAWESRGWREALEADLAARQAALCAAAHRFALTDVEAVSAMVAALAVERRDAHAHAWRVSASARATASLLGLDGADRVLVARAALVHDIGKLALPPAILDKPAPLTAEERAIARRFPLVGADIVAGLPDLAAAATLVRDAQERMDGHGYPRGISAAGVELGARIIGVADAFDAMTHPRPFRDPLTPGDALLELERCAGTQFDPVVVAAFLTAATCR